MILPFKLIVLLYLVETGKDFICVQSIDGTLSIFEQETFAFSRFLPGALLPGPIRFIAQTDSFVTVSTCRQVESYKYGGLY